MKKRFILPLVLACASVLHAEVIDTDIVVFGGTAGGVSAACTASKLGKKVVLTEFGKHIGGLTSGGLGWTDIGNKAAIGGFGRDFYKRLGKHYGKPEAWTFEPSVAETNLRDLLKENSVPVYMEQRLATVKKDGARITEISMENGNVFRAKMFIDATYEGDLMAKAGVKYLVGRESNEQFGETLNGIREKTPQHQFLVPVDPYVKPGDPSSGLLPFVQNTPFGQPGAGDPSVQAYNFRICLTKNPENMKPIEPPPGYDAKRYELLGRYFDALKAAGKTVTIRNFLKIDMVTPEKTDINNNGGFSTDYIGANYNYPDADYATREKIWKDHENYIRGFLTFLATDPRVPETIRTEMQQWGFPKDEFQDTGGWPHAMYVREARRMLGEYVMAEKNCRWVERVEDPVGLGAYNMDSHNCRRIVRDGKVENEGDVQVGVKGPYGVSYRSIVPKADECENLLVPVALSATHIAYGSIRMEPVFMILGQSAATAASFALDGNVTVQKVDYAKLRERLLADKQILEWDPALKGQSSDHSDVTHGAPAPKLPGIVLDDLDAVKTGDWVPGNLTDSRRVGSGYVHDNNGEKGRMAVKWSTVIPEAGEYEAFLHFPPNSNRATNALVSLEQTGGEPKSVKVNEKNAAGKQSLGTLKLGKGDTITVTLSNKDTDGYVVADGVQLLKK
ncbi:FAD-dependent oxidoreductase [Verrucomicrobiota bacterium sgz303538]